MRSRFVKALGALGAIAAAVGVWLRCGPLPEGLLDPPARVSTTVVDRRGVPLYEARSGDGTRSVSLDADALPPSVVAATVAVEDGRFWKHVGVDPLAIGRAAFANVRAGRIEEGGSTITQQTAKLLLARREAGSSEGSRARGRGLAAKIDEMVIALRLEHRLSKAQILALYLNLAPYGNQIVGIERASHAYFGTPAGQLTVAQAAFLSALPQRPSVFSKGQRPALVRQRHVINRMVSLGLITRAAAFEAQAETLTFVRESPTFVAPHFVEMVLASRALSRPGRIETTLDAELQAEIAGILRSQRASLDRYRARNVAVVVLQNATGEWLAWEGSGSYFDDRTGGAINGPMVLRQPGSALKPFTYALAFEERYGPASVLPDVPSYFPTAEQGILYTPRNYDGQFRGPLLARRALAGSENVPAVALAAHVGTPKLIRLLRNVGITSFEKTAAHYGLGITLGNAEVRLAELTAAYSTFARGGVYLEPVALKTELQSRRDSVRVVSPRAAFWVTDILADSSAREFIFGRGGSLDFPFPVAVKTGTSEGFRDNWTIGYTRDVTVGVWVGNFDRTPLANSSGVTGAGPVFHSVMMAAQRRVAGHLMESHAPLAQPPSNVERRQICALSGMRANAWCPSRASEWVASEDPGLPCSWHHQTAEEGLLTVWPAEYRDWAETNGLLRDSSRPGPSMKTTAPQGKVLPARFAITSPPNGAVYLIDPTLRREFQTLSLRASSENGAIEWVVDGQRVGVSDSSERLDWPLAPGEHEILARDGRGRTAQSSIMVK